jgi:phage protein D
MVAGTGEETAAAAAPIKYSPWLKKKGDDDDEEQEAAASGLTLGLGLGFGGKASVKCILTHILSSCAPESQKIIFRAASLQ